MSDKGETALARWSQLKRANREAKPEPPSHDQLAKAASAPRREAEVVAPEHDSEPGENQKDDPAECDSLDLPDIGDLDADSDYTAFLREGVSEEVRRKALRVLWRSDPLLANLDGLNDYDEDFNSAAILTEAARTAYRAGKGYLHEDDDRSGSENDPAPDRLEAPENQAAHAPRPENNATEATDVEEGPDPSGDRPNTEGQP